MRIARIGLSHERWQRRTNGREEQWRWENISYSGRTPKLTEAALALAEAARGIRIGQLNGRLTVG